MKAIGLTCLKYSLGPILWMQGLRVRSRTPTLPEPSGDRSGEVGSGQSLRLLIVGDSSAAGVGVSKQQDALLGRVVQALAADFNVNYHLLAKTGAKTSDALVDLQQAIQQKWVANQKFDVVVTALGVNDVTAQVSLKKWCRQQQSLITSIQQNLRPELLIISGLPPMHKFPALPMPLRQYLGAWASLFNKSLQQLTKQQTKSRFLSVADLPPPVDVAIDGFHPGSATYQQWALAVADLITENLAITG